MGYFLTGLLSAMIGGGVVLLTMAAIQINFRENSAGDESGAPEGHINFPEVR